MEYLEQAQAYLFEYGPTALLALVVLLVGWAVIARFTNWASKNMEKRGIDSSLRPFIRSMLNITLKALLILSVLSMVGVEVTSFIAILGAAGLAIGLALQGTLQNFAGGVLILLFKPFKVGDYIEGQGHAGSVAEIQIFNTILKTPDNKTIIIPNGGLATNSLINYSAEPTRRVDFEFGIGYGDSTEQARQILLSLINEDERIHKDPAPFVEVGALADSSVNFTVRVWANAGDYWGIYFSLPEKVYNAFNKEGINIPFPQMDVHLHQDN